MENSITPAVVAALVKQMTLGEKVTLLGGANMWESAAIPRLGIGSMKTTDGPAGARGAVWFGGSTSAFIPCGISLGATFSLPLIQEAGKLLGAETKTKNAHILLAPTMNMSRSPFGGRNFENFGEDPFHTGAMARSIVAGIQSEGVGACVKHFVGNEQESRRFNIDEKIDERTLREIYLLPFQIALESDPWMLMTSYNKINGEHVDVSKKLLQGVVRDDWGYQGMTISDWGGTNSVVGSIEAGTDLEMPGPPVMRGKPLLEALERGEITEEVLNPCVSRILYTCQRASVLGPFPDEVMNAIRKEMPATLEAAKLDEYLSRAFQNEPKKDPNSETSLNLPEHRKLLKDIATNSIVLLKNNGILPLGIENLQDIAIIGPNAKRPTAGGSGSAALDPHYMTTPYDSFVSGSKVRNPAIITSFAQGILTHKLLPVLGDLITTMNGTKKGLKMDFYAGYELSGEVIGTRFWSSSNVFLMTDGDLPESLKGSPYSFILSGTLKATSTGIHTFGISSIGKGKLFINDELIIDNTAWTQRGDTFMNCGSVEARATLELAAGVEYTVRVEQAATPPPLKPHDNTLFGFLSGIRIGMLPPIDEDCMMAEAVQAARDAKVAILVLGMNNDWEREGVDRSTLSLPCRTNELISAVCAVNSNTIVVNQSACAVDMSAWSDAPAAIIQAWYQGQENGNAITEVLLGSANPSGKLPITFPRRIEDHGTADCFPGDVENDVAEYKEGIFSGYRWFDKCGTEPLWAFGYGLSYTTFAISEIKARGTISATTSATVSITIENTGKVAGAEVLQVYVSSSPEILAAGLDSVPKSLKGFCKVDLNPGEKREVAVQLDKMAVSWYDISIPGWRLDPGEYTAWIGTSSRDIKGAAKIIVT